MVDFSNLHAGPTVPGFYPVPPECGYIPGYQVWGCGITDNVRKRWLNIAPRCVIYVSPGVYINTYAQNMREDGGHSYNSCYYSSIDGKSGGAITLDSKIRGENVARHLAMSSAITKHGAFLGMDCGTNKFGRYALATKLGGTDVGLFRFIIDNQQGNLGSAYWCIFLCRDKNILRNATINPSVFDGGAANTQNSFVEVTFG